ncbi:MAG: 7-cyano-7-deazaguanine synthase [Phycisphaerales bacterium]|nr:MAG: 7-cyano-7-deazaguanine synthase [Phycisphaerales bacterium]
MAAVVALTSGGIKSAVAAARYAQDHEVLLVHVDYGQASAQAERKLLHPMADAFPSGQPLGIELPYVKAVRPQALTADGILEGEPEDLSPLAIRGIMPLLIAVGLQCAARLGATVLTTGLNEAPAEEPSLLASADGRPGRAHEFIQTAQMMIQTALPEKHPIRLEAPLLDASYGEIIKLAMRFQVPLEKTWSCLGTGPRPCTKCAACRARQNAFLDAHLVDPATSQVAVET